MEYYTYKPVHYGCGYIIIKTNGQEAIAANFEECRHLLLKKLLAQVSGVKDMVNPYLNQA